MITRLTPEQTHKLAEYRDRAIRLALRPKQEISMAEATIYSDRLNRFLGRPLGETIIRCGPTRAWSDVLVGASSGDVHEQVWSQVWSQFRNYRPRLPSGLSRSVYWQVWTQVQPPIVSQIASQVRDQVEERQPGFCWSWLEGPWWACHAVFLDYLREVLNINLLDYSLLKDQLNLGLTYPLGNGVVIYSENALYFKLAQDRLHFDGGPAWEYKDGTKGWSLNGVCVPQNLAETPAEDLNCEEWIKDTDRRVFREFVRKVGAARLLVKLGARLLDRKNDYGVHEINLCGDRLRWLSLKGSDPDAEPWRFERVHRACSTVDEAIAWLKHRTKEI